VVCGDPIDESAGEVPVFMDPELAAEYDHEGTAYHLNACEVDVFSEVYAEVSE
jgi:hypothetical protein